MTDLLLKEFPALPRGAQTPQAIILRGNYTYDDTASHIPRSLRRTVPVAMKKDGKLYLYKNEEGFLYMKSPTGGWGTVLFIRNGVYLNLVLPLSYMVIGKSFRSLLDKKKDEAPPVVIVSTLSLQSGSTKVKRFIRTLWETARRDETILRSLGVGHNRFMELFSDQSFTTNVEIIINGLVPEAKRILQDGNFGLQDLLGLPDATIETNHNQGVYLRIYEDVGGQDVVGLYVGQSRHISRRMGQHDTTTKSSTLHQFSKHYGIARQTTEDNCHAVKLCAWSIETQIPLAILDLAEQTMMLLFDSYHSWMTSETTEPLGEGYSTMRSHCAYLRSIAEKTRTTVGWQNYLDVDTVGCNVSSPLFDVASYKGGDIRCIKMPVLDPNVRTFTTYRKETTFIRPKRQKGACNVRILDLTTSRPNGAVSHIIFSIAIDCFQAFIPKTGNLVFEIMDDHGPHEKPWLGCPTVGPFQDFTEASSLAVRAEWLDIPSGEWRTAPIQSSKSHMWRIDWAKRNWMRAMSVIQLLEGIVWTEPLNGFENLSLGSRQVKELTVNHLQQTCHWIPRLGKGARPAPALSSWDENFKLMAKQFGHGMTVLGCDPPSTSDLEIPSIAFVACDFCKYAKTSNTYHCERDPGRDDIWVCKRCSEMNRPCSFTPMTESFELWGRGPPDLRQNQNLNLALYPTGPHRQLAFHLAIHIDQMRTPVRIEEPFAMETAVLEQLDVEEDLIDEIDEADVEMED
ncbi:hypothetical protein AU210_005668 [Fusarium oxysporum f. sp. radicis-cucumerinum]|uniref:GIY-YIG domain-containing protein n=2 Tax=Fusarium oxysporum TaxID=5507 RepID=A0A2H3HDT1_FUSOX|nr:hypothetical protein AU210_005668 [Fusarium oxysporum f. sp. radicis-cucumerinum]RKK22427.1 hypothetical protein BFJ65_g5029 [Fusarium oxysporum f. sp. cepae]RKK43780.1 hypothetical protein BFJ66_g9821 [Fusarium oxysporum f. sp. cepae]RKK47689.1 hypothetical protein BFJ67_g7677 [Fusarium oxysporum f. sp. cepae]